MELTACTRSVPEFFSRALVIRLDAAPGRVDVRSVSELLFCYKLMSKFIKKIEETTKSEKCLVANISQGGDFTTFNSKINLVTIIIPDSE